MRITSEQLDQAMAGCGVYPHGRLWVARVGWASTVVGYGLTAQEARLALRRKLAWIIQQRLYRRLGQHADHSTVH
jgi:hypothetical protein